VKSYYRLLLGAKNVFAQQCFDENFIGTDFAIHVDLTDELPDSWQDFNTKFIPVFLANHPGKGKISAGLACGMLWTVSRGIKDGDIVICRDASGLYHSAEVCGPYFYVPDGILMHRRPVKWLPGTFQKEQMSEAMQNSMGSIGTVSNVTKYAAELSVLVGIAAPVESVALTGDSSVEDPQAFALEKHLEEFLIANWSKTQLGNEYDLYSENGEKGQQYQTDTGPLDILAISKDKSKLLVVELKRGRASDSVVGQTLRYMSYVREMLADENQAVHGMIIALEDDKKIRRALEMTRNIDFFRYQLDFKLVKG
jgi:restriction system protein